MQGDNHDVQINLNHMQRYETEKGRRFRERPGTGISEPSGALPSDEKSVVAVTEEIHKRSLRKRAGRRNKIIGKLPIARDSI